MICQADIEKYLKNIQNAGIKKRMTEVILELPKSGEPAGARTPDHRLKRAMLYRLSYRPTLVNETLSCLMLFNVALIFKKSSPKLKKIGIIFDGTRFCPWSSRRETFPK